jgi:hypothetical protein
VGLTIVGAGLGEARWFIYICEGGNTKITNNSFPKGGGDAKVGSDAKVGDSFDVTANSPIL